MASKDGRTWEQRKPAHQAWLKANPEKAKAYNAKAYEKRKGTEKHKSQVRAACKRWRNSHKKYNKIRLTKWRKDNPSYRAVYHANHRAQENTKNAAWEKSHPEQVLTIKRRRRARQLGAKGRHTAQQWIRLCNKYGNVCLRCGNKRKLTCDHIVPLCHGGSNYISNIQPLCKSCNSHKGTKHTNYRRKHDCTRTS